MNGPAIPGWPGALHLEWTAAYVSLGKTKWLELVDKGEAPAPIQLTPGRKAWLRVHLDAWLADRAAREQDRQAPNPWDGPAR